MNARCPVGRGFSVVERVYERNAFREVVKNHDEEKGLATIDGVTEGTTRAVAAPGGDSPVRRPSSRVLEREACPAPEAASTT